jgi:hypothetical protein
MIADDMNVDPVDISGQLKFSSQEQSDMKAAQINYDLEAVELNKIDECSVENSSDHTSSFSSNLESQSSQNQDSKKSGTP